MTKTQKENIVLKKAIKFSLDIIEYCEDLEKQKKYIIGRQLLKSGTSIGANLHEAQNSESKADFIHKVKIAAKELEETKYWITLCKESKSYPFKIELEDQVNEIGLIVYKILSTSSKYKN